MLAALVAIAVGTSAADVARKDALRAEIVRAVSRHQQMLRSHERRHHELMSRLARGSRERLRKIDARIAALQREPDSGHKTAMIAEFKSLRHYYADLSRYELPDKK